MKKKARVFPSSLSGARHASFSAQTEFSKRQQNGEINFCRQAYPPRQIILILGAVALLPTLYRQDIEPSIWVLLGLHALIWPPIAYYRSVRHAHPLRAELHNLVIDAFLCGFWIAFSHFSLLPSAVAISMISMINIAAGAMKQCVRALFAVVISAFITTLLNGFAPIPVTTTMDIYAVLPLLLVAPAIMALIAFHTAKKLREKKQQLLNISLRDGLTGIYNRRHWEHLLHRQFESMKRYEQYGTLIMLDIDNFKSINDTYGHLIGDEIVTMVAEELLLGLRTIDIVGRYGGDEFGAILPNTHVEEAIEAFARIQQQLRNIQLNEAPGLHLTISAGIAENHSNMLHYRDWLAAADKALYQAKANGRNRMEIAAKTSATIPIESN